jgi:hypothetical protein
MAAPHITIITFSTIYKPFRTISIKDAYDHDDVTTFRSPPIKITKKTTPKTYPTFGKPKISHKYSQEFDTLILHKTTRRYKCSCSTNSEGIMSYFRFLMSIEIDKLKTMITPSVSTIGQILKSKQSIGSRTKKNIYTKEGIDAYTNFLQKVYSMNRDNGICSISQLPHQKYIRRYTHHPENKIIIDFDIDCLSHVMGNQCSRKISLNNVISQLVFMKKKDCVNFITKSFIPYLYDNLFDDPYKEYSIVIDRSTLYSHVKYDIPLPTKPCTVRFGIFTKKCVLCKKSTSRYTPSWKFIQHSNVHARQLFYNELNMCLSCGHATCSLCDNEPHPYTSPCPKKIIPITSEELDSIEGALEDETARCPTCDHVCTKDDACDKVQCGRVDGGRQEGCGTTFCFRCKEIIDNHDYLTHLSVSQKPDGTDTHWVCRSFTRNCPTCSKTQFYDGTQTSITCGTCQTSFEP